MPLTRTTHWATRELHDFLMERADEPFAWGKNDCCLFPADAILAMTGVDLAADFRGTYANDVEALTAVYRMTRKPDRKGFTMVGNAAEYCAQQQGLEEYQHPRCAQRGDLVVLENLDGCEMAGIVGLTGRHIVTVAAPGLVTFSIERVKRAWRV